MGSASCRETPTKGEDNHMKPIKKNTSGEDRHMNPMKKSTSKKIAPTTAIAQTASPGPAPMAAFSTAEQPAPAPQATQAPTPASPTPSTPATQVTSVGNRVGKKEALQTSLVALIAGLQANFAADFVFNLPTGPVTTSALIATFTQYIQAAETTKGQYLSWRKAVAAEKPIEQQVTSTRALVKTVLLGTYGAQSPDMLQFGFAPYKARVTSAAAKTVGAAKANATRKSSGKVKKQKLTVTATGTGVTITPADAPNAGSAPAAAPKPTAS
jgi:hypothetical protein